MILDQVSPLVMTSANISGEPIIIDDNEINKFGVDVLSHNREILTPLDDSVVCVMAGRTQFIRRARGYVPLSIEINRKAKSDTLCLGGDLKSVFAFHRDRYVFLSQSFGALDNKDVYDCYKSNITRFATLHGFEQETIVCRHIQPLLHTARLRLFGHLQVLGYRIARPGVSGQDGGYIF